MYKKVLAAVNEHLNSEVSARYALHLAKQAKARITEFGRNEITAVKGKNLVLRLLSQFTHFLAIVLWLAAFFRSFPSTSIPARACSPSASPS